ncbi:BofC C-terminal domain-containing protein [Thermosyntropha lipolytica DSM 11003]|uniref:BofC C-terminal domain-containing protein n=1 Tax=Thermosyntropha lipolytica DSM 11003 TaxID=1123382 RepID=A0A1M5P9X0_9FIRM|nr:BofC C-terminal domain-containing protein [Thermosyntropha lipolytica]SHG98614.1 BofC C-terminal domain-containing protein [Thermosyntropha lipolytica DSM 11003]
MIKKGQSILFLITLGLFFGAGYFLAGWWSDFSAVDKAKKPVMEDRERNDLISEENQVIYEEFYTRCGHVIISSFPYRESLNGKTVDEIKNIYKEKAGYEIKREEETLIIRHTIDGYCPAEYERRRLKEYQGYVAIFKGPKEEEVLEKVTNIKIENLPAEEQAKIKRGDYEFRDEEAMQDALENFDEFI